MGKVLLDISMSLDGFITAANSHPEQPVGDGGLKLVEWAMDTGDTRNREYMAEGISGLGAVIAGRRTYDTSVPWWGADGPIGAARVPVIVVSHSVPQETPAGGVYTFANGIEEALARAKEAAGDKYVSVMGGAEIVQQYLRAGLIDEIQIHLAPLLFGSGTRLFDHLGGDHTQLETVKVVETTTAIHLHFRVVK